MSFEDLCREVAKSGEPWDITLLDEMMSSAVLPGEPRRVTFQQVNGKDRSTALLH